MLQLELTQDEALVLFELLTRFSECEKKNSATRTLILEHPAERAALWRLTGAIEGGVSV
jgi:hypothetical protein